MSTTLEVWDNVSFFPVFKNLNFMFPTMLTENEDETSKQYSNLYSRGYSRGDPFGITFQDFSPSAAF